jgi:hypothetical protein
MKRTITVMTLMLFVIVMPHCKKEKKEETVAVKGYINFVNGDVKLLTADGKENPVKIGDEVVQGSKIKTTGQKSFVDIYIGENAVKILGDTIVEVKKLLTNVATNGEESVFFVEKGKLFSRVTKKLTKNDIFEVKTPTTTAGVRGTDFLVTEEDGKANVACLKGKVGVSNNSMPDQEPVMVETEKEVDVEPNKPMSVKELSESNRKMMEDIIQNISELRAEIWEKMRKQREEIRQYVIDQREKDKSLVEEQKEKDKALVEDQKARDKQMIEDIKGDTTDKGDEAVRAAKDKMDAAKDVDTDSMKPKIEKPKLDLDKFKPKQ